MMMATMTEKGQVVIPATVRDHLHLKTGERFIVEEADDEIRLIRVSVDYYKKTAGFLSTNGKLCRALLAERKKDAESE